MVEKKLFLIVALLVVSIASYEDSETLAKRIKFYKNIKKYSNNTMDVGYDPVMGLTCIANDYLEVGQKVLQIPKSQTMCPYFMYPFKFEIIDALYHVPNLNSTIGIEQKFTVFVLTYYLLYHLYAPKDEIKQFINDNNLVEYMEIHEPDNSFVESLPKILLTSTTLENEHLQLLAALGFPTEKHQELENVYNYVLIALQKSSYYPLIFPWASNYERFLLAYANVMSRGMTLRLNEYNTLENYRDRKKTAVEEKNYQIFQTLSKNVGSPCLIAYIDLCNHHQPKYDDMRDKRAIILDTIPGYFINTLSVGYKPGDEMTYTYTFDPSNIVLYFHYGFIIRDNIFNFAHLRYDNTDEFTPQQMNLCKELGCNDNSMKDPNTPKTKMYKAKLNSVDETAITYARVKYLPSNFDHRPIVKKLANGEIVSYENEMNAWLWYYKNSRKSLKNERFPLMRSIRKAQKHADICREIEKNWGDDEKLIKEWSRNKHFEMIYKMDISYKIVMHRQVKASVNKVILHTTKEIENLKAKYF
jgi:hypothetical protein